MSLSRVDFPQHFVISRMVLVDIHQLIGEFFYSVRCLFGKFTVECWRTCSSSSTIIIITFNFNKESIDCFLCSIIFALGQHLGIVLSTLLTVYSVCITQIANICIPSAFQSCILFFTDSLRSRISSPVGQMRLDIRIKCLDLWHECTSFHAIEVKLILTIHRISSEITGSIIFHPIDFYR